MVYADLKFPCLPAPPPVRAATGRGAVWVTDSPTNCIFIGRPA